MIDSDDLIWRNSSWASCHGRPLRITLWLKAGNEPLARTPKLLQTLKTNGFDVNEGHYQVLDAFKRAYEGVIPNNRYRLADRQRNLDGRVSVRLKGS